jgi:hypothetical protein
MDNMRPVYKHNESAYVVLQEKAIHHFAKTMDDLNPNMEYVQMYMKWLGADHVLRNQTHFIFCETIPDIDFEIVE